MDFRRPIAEMCFHIIADDRRSRLLTIAEIKIFLSQRSRSLTIAEKRFHIVADAFSGIRRSWAIIWKLRLNDCKQEVSQEKWTVVQPSLFANLLQTISAVSRFTFTWCRLIPLFTMSVHQRRTIQYSTIQYNTIQYNIFILTPLCKA